MKACSESNDYCPVFFKWYKYTGLITNTVASIAMQSPRAKPVRNLHYAALIGLLNRCSRLMLANVALSHEGLFGETTALIDRCIFESCVKVQWLCLKASEESFGRYTADGLKAELSLKCEIKTRITSGTGVVLPIEQRMLDSIERCLLVSELSETQIADIKKLPDIATMLVELGRDKLDYVVGQKIGSHYVHGTWLSLLFHYLEQDDDGMFHPRDHNIPTHVNQYVFIQLIVIDANKAFSAWLLNEPNATWLTNKLQFIKDELLSTYREIVANN